VLVGDHLLLRDFEPYGIIFKPINVCVVITADNAGKEFWDSWDDI
jgi:hypothetical protein